MLIPRLAESLKTAGVSACDKRQLYNYLRFYQTCPEIAEPLVGLYENTVPGDLLITVSPKVRSVTTQFRTLSLDLIKTLSYQHLEQIFPIEDPLKRRF